MHGKTTIMLVAAQTLLSHGEEEFSIPDDAGRRVMCGLIADA
jgi:hypothetical protein